MLWQLFNIMCYDNFEKTSFKDRQYNMPNKNNMHRLA